MSEGGGWMDREEARELNGEGERELNGGEGAERKRNGGESRGGWVLFCINMTMVSYPPF